MLRSFSLLWVRFLVLELAFCTSRLVVSDFSRVLLTGVKGSWVGRISAGRVGSGRGIGLA